MPGASPTPVRHDICFQLNHIRFDSVPDSRESFRSRTIDGNEPLPAPLAPPPPLAGEGREGALAASTAAAIAPQLRPIGHHVEIAETQDTITLCCKKCLALGIARRVSIFKMPAAVDLDNELGW